MARLGDFRRARRGRRRGEPAALLPAAGCGADPARPRGQARAPALAAAWLAVARPRRPGRRACAPSLRPLWLSSAPPRPGRRRRVSRGRAWFRARSPWPATRSRAWCSCWAPTPSWRTPKTAAAAIAEGRPAIVEGRDDAAFRAALAADGARAALIGAVPGLDYSNGHRDILRIYRPPTLTAPAPAAGTERP